MQSILVLIAAPGSGAIDHDLVARLSREIGSEARWLATREAVEFLVSESLDEAKIRTMLERRPVDIAVVGTQGRRKRLLIADMDSTMIGQECIDELGILAGVGDRISDITARAMRGELDFEAALKERVGLMRGLPRHALATVLSDRITFTAGGRSLIQTMRSHGAYTALVSGGFVEFTGFVTERLGFHEHRANEFLWHEEMLTGEVREPILGRDAKVSALRELCAQLGVTPADAIAVGDGANDIPMLEAAGMGVALHAKPKVREAAPIRIDHGDLTALLYLQGYRREDFVE
ncbi:MAG: phosphoserine phosphatase SerB [Hyphomicrobiales bacterium]